MSTHDLEAYRLAWDRIRTVRDRARWSKVAAWVTGVAAFVSGMGPGHESLTLALGALVATAVVAALIFGSTPAPCPACGHEFFPTRLRRMGTHEKRDFSATRCAHCAIGRGVLPHALNPLAELAGERGLRVADGRTVEGDLRGVRVAIEVTTNEAPSAAVSVDASNAPPHALEELRVRIATELPRARVVTGGANARVELDADDATPDALDTALDALLDACATNDRPYR